MVVFVKKKYGGRRELLKLPKEFGKGVFEIESRLYLRVRQRKDIFFIHTTPEKIENATITGRFGFLLEKTSAREIT